MVTKFKKRRNFTAKTLISRKFSQKVIKPKKGKSSVSFRFHQVQILAVKYFMKRAYDRPTMPLIMPHMCPYRPGAIYSTPGEPQRPLCVKTRLSIRFHRR